jgi:hypothetical protein
LLVLTACIMAIRRLREFLQGNAASGEGKSRGSATISLNSVETAS